MNPIFLAKALVIKVTEFALGLHPFAQSDNSASLTGLFGDYNPMDWGGASRVDALLVFGLQWISHFLLLPFLAVGFFGLWRYNPRGLIVLSVLWLVFSVVTLFTGNATRWGLPSMLVYYVMVAVGYAWFAGRIYQFFFFTIGLLVAVVAVRLTLFPVPMIVVLAGSLGLIWWFQPEPLGLHRGGRRHNDSYLSRSSQ